MLRWHQGSACAFGCRILGWHFARNAERRSEMKPQKQSFFKPSADNLTRREFLGGVIGTSLIASLAGPELLAAGEENGIPYRRLGRSGERVSVVGLGGYHIGVPSSEQEGIRIIRTALD